MQLALYERGRAALRGGKLTQAISTFEAYRRRFPRGELRTETGLSLLDALFRAGRLARAEALAAALLRDGVAAERRGEVLRVRAEALARLGRCDSAQQVFGLAVGHPGSGLTTERILNALRTCREGATKP